MKGQEAKDRVIKTIATAFGDKYIGEIEKKVYVWSEENGAPMQVCLALTIPKNPIDTEEMNKPTVKIEFVQDTPGIMKPTDITDEDIIQAAEISAKEKQIAEDLLKKLGL